ncbi:hypothetical protein PIB30_028367 [Stylosanthes scabra]|uniref:Glycosyltransferase n=1 Tax=Stylosanthes scabra TaxID=79078 RepID=A0ABU6SBQ3_9FABA|nr:hypothetical protein [Stylosanthes scabra]
MAKKDHYDHDHDDFHIVMVPFMAKGHLIPFLELATHIQQRISSKITIASTPLNIQHLIKHHNQYHNHNHNHNHIHFAELPFNPAQHGLPPNGDNTANLRLEHIQKLAQASLSLEEPLSSLISKIKEEEGHPPLCIISDLFLGWVNNVAKSFGIKNITFNTSGAYGTLANMTVWFNLPHRNSSESDSDSDSDEFSVPGFPENYKFRRSHMYRYLREVDAISNDRARFIVSQFSLSMKSDGWICNTIEEVDSLGLDLLRKHIHLPIWSVGPLRRPLPLKGKETSMANEKCIEWLNLKDERSVLYICFGSQNTISASQMMALAEGLEKSETSFIWVVRPPLGFDINGEFNAHEWLPKGFEERIKNAQKGLLVHQWGPQMKILSHKSIAAFVSHCGWNSVMESLSCGVPIIGWPLAAEQAYNAKMLDEELGVGVILTATVESVVSNEEVKNVIEMVMDQERGKGMIMKKKAEEIEVLMREATMEKAKVKGSSIKAMDDFVRSILPTKTMSM